MPDIFTKEWYEAMLTLANSRDDLSAQIPQGEWKVAIEIEGDGKSPYIPEGEMKSFYVYVVDGKIIDIQENSGKITTKGLNFRFTGPADIWDGIAAGIVDPVEKGLDGSINVRGDMRILMQHADLVPTIIDFYTSSEITDWPKGKPPYQV